MYELVSLYRGDDFSAHPEDTVVKEGDEILIVTRLEDVNVIYDLFQGKEE